MRNRIRISLALIAAAAALFAGGPAAAEPPAGDPLEQAYQQIFAPVAPPSGEGVRPIPAAPTYTYCCLVEDCCELVLLANCLNVGGTGWKTAAACQSNCLFC